MDGESVQPAAAAAGTTSLQVRACRTDMGIE